MVTTKPFGQLRIVEVSGSEAGAYCAKLFADLGARVIKVEPPGGDPARGKGTAWGRSTAEFEWLNTSKDSVVIDLAGGGGTAELRDLLSRADVLVESSAPNPLAPMDMADPPVGLVRVMISPFGLSGPYAGHRSNAFTDEAIGGHLYLNGEPDREPIRRPGRHALLQAATQAFIGAVAALFARRRDGLGQAVEVSHFEGFASLHQHTTSMWMNGGFILRREGNRQPGPYHPVGVYPCKDGYVHLSLPGAAMVEPFLAAAGLSQVLEDPRFATDFARATHKDEFDAAILPWLRAHTVAEIVELGQAVFTPVGPVPGLLEVANDEHLAARRYFVEMPGEPPLRMPRGPFRVEGHPFEPRPAPAPGERGEPPESAVSHETAAASIEAPPLEGVKILDLTRVWAGPLAGRILADLGADVVLVERPTGRGPRNVSPLAAQISHLYPDNDVGERPWNRVSGFNKLMRNRRGITLDLTDADCKALFAELVKSADVVMENFSPRAMPQLGFGDEVLRALNPGVIHCSMPGYGASGPHKNWVAFGPLIEASSGLSSTMGYADSGPYRSGIAFPDPVSGLSAAAGILVALWDREASADGRGRNVEAAMIESMVSMIGDQVVAAQAQQADPPRRGNRDPRWAPNGCYRCAGDDRWVAISVTSDGEWRSLCEYAGLGVDWAAWTFEERQRRHDEIDERLSRWTRAHDPRSLMWELQGRGVMAAMVADGRDLVEDPHLAERGFWARIEHPEVGLRSYPGTPIRLSRTPVTYRLPAPTFGQHNDEVLGEAGASAELLAALRERGAICEAPPG